MEDLRGVGVDQVNDDRLYAGLDQLLPRKEAIEKHLAEHWGELFDLDYDLLLYEVTSTYFEGECKRFLDRMDKGRGKLQASIESARLKDEGVAQRRLGRLQERYWRAGMSFRLPGSAARPGATFEQACHPSGWPGRARLSAHRPGRAARLTPGSQTSSDAGRAADRGRASARPWC